MSANTPEVMRPTFPEGYVHPTSWLTWEEVRGRLTEAKNYWLCTVRPNGHPHAITKWGVWVADNLYCDGSPETRHGRNIARNPHVVIHLEDGNEAVIIEGVCEILGKPEREIAQQVAQGYARKYEGYAPEPTSWDEGGLFVVTPHTVMAWTDFVRNPTKFVFDGKE